MKTLSVICIVLSPYLLWAQPEGSSTSFPKTSSNIYLKITAPDGEVSEVTLMSISHKAGVKKFGEDMVVRVSNGMVQTIGLAMEYMHSNAWERLDQVVPESEYKPYYIPSISVALEIARFEKDGFASPYMTALTSIPARVGSRKVVEHFTIEVVEILDRYISGDLKRFEATAAEAACLDMKYTNSCIQNFKP